MDLFTGLGPAIFPTPGYPATSTVVKRDRSLRWIVREGHCFKKPFVRQISRA